MNETNQKSNPGSYYFLGKRYQAALHPCQSSLSLTPTNSDTRLALPLPSNFVWSLGTETIETIGGGCASDYIQKSLHTNEPSLTHNSYSTSSLQSPSPSRFQRKMNVENAVGKCFDSSYTSDSTEPSLTHDSPMSLCSSSSSSPRKNDDNQAGSSNAPMSSRNTKGKRKIVSGTEDLAAVEKTGRTKRVRNEEKRIEAAQKGGSVAKENLDRYESSVLQLFPRLEKYQEAEAISSISTTDGKKSAEDVLCSSLKKNLNYLKGKKEEQLLTLKCAHDVLQLCNIPKTDVRIMTRSEKLRVFSPTHRHINIVYYSVSAIEQLSIYVKAILTQKSLGIKVLCKLVQTIEDDEENALNIINQYAKLDHSAWQISDFLNELATIRPSYQKVLEDKGVPISIIDSIHSHVIGREKEFSKFCASSSVRNYKGIGHEALLKKFEQSKKSNKIKNTPVDEKITSKITEKCSLLDRMHIDCLNGRDFVFDAKNFDALYSTVQEIRQELDSIIIKFATTQHPNNSVDPNQLL